MTLYVDSSALLKRYVDEPDSEACEAILRSDPALVTGRHTIVEVTSAKRRRRAHSASPSSARRRHVAHDRLLARSSRMP